MMKALKILIITDAWHPQINGVVRTYEYLKQELESQSHSVFIFSPHHVKYTLPMPGYAEIRLSLFPRPMIKKTFDDFQPDIVHIATEGPLGWAARSFCLDNAISFTTTYHTHFPDYVAKRLAKYIPILYKPFRYISRSIVRHFHSPSSTLFTATQSLEDDLSQLGYTAPKKRLTRGVDQSVFFPGESTALKDVQGPIALYVGRIAIEKNLEAFLDMAWEGTKVLVGPGPSLNSYQKKYPDAVFLGPKMGSDLADIYRASDVFVFPSKTDTFGMVLIEALACGLPIAAYNVCGPRDIVTEPFLGVLTEDNLGDATAKALTLKQKKAARVEHVNTYYTWPLAAQQFIGI